MGVKGFPTLKIIRPSKRAGGKPIVEDYQGERTTKAIVNAVIEKIPNHVKRLSENSMDKWLGEHNETAKAILLTEKGTVSALWRALAIDYLSVVNFGQIRNKEKALVDMFGVEKFPAVVLLPGGDKAALKYEGELKKEDIMEFVNQAATVVPNPDPPKGKPKKADAKKSAGTDKKGKKAKKEKAPPAEKKKTEKKAEKVEKPVVEKTEQPVEEKPTEQEEAKEPWEKAHASTTEDDLRQKCFMSNSGVCAFVILPPSASQEEGFTEEITHALNVITDVYKKHLRRQGTAKGGLQFHVLEDALPLATDLRTKLGLKPKALQIVAVNSRRLWFRKYPKRTYGHADVDAWVDAVRMDEGDKEVLPEEFVTEFVPEPEEKIEEKVEEEKKEEKTEEDRVRDEL
jgi:protein disulfide-isomerase A6